MAYLDELFSVEGKVALITGAASGIGLMAASALVRAGARLLNCSRRAHACEAAAAACFMERGYAATSIDDVARRLGATKGRIYHHFPSKADLFAEVFRMGMALNYEAVEPFVHSTGPALPRWRSMAKAHVMQMIVTKPFQRAVWIGVEMHLRGATTPEQRDVFSRLIEYRTQYGNLFRATLLQGRDEGVFRFVNLSITNQLMFMALNSPIFWYTQRPGESHADTEAVADQVVDYALGGLVGTAEGQ
jgi:AcrR family transcriptional regulator